MGKGATPAVAAANPWRGLARGEPRRAERCRRDEAVPARRPRAPGARAGERGGPQRPAGRRLRAPHRHPSGCVIRRERDAESTLERREQSRTRLRLVRGSTWTAGRIDVNRCARPLAPWIVGTSGNPASQYPLRGLYACPLMVTGAARWWRTWRRIQGEDSLTSPSMSSRRVRKRSTR